MNQDRRKRLAKIQADLTQAMEAAATNLQEVIDEEQEAFDNLPESLQMAERGQDMETALDAMTMALDALEDSPLADLDDVQ